MPNSMIIQSLCIWLAVGVKIENWRSSKSGNIHYNKADIHDVSVGLIANAAILLNEIILLAIVGSNEVTNRFMVTEVYQKEDYKWTLGSLFFTKSLDKE